MLRRLPRYLLTAPPAEPRRHYLTAQQAAEALVLSGAKRGWTRDGAVELAVAGGTFRAVEGDGDPFRGHDLSEKLHARLVEAIRKELVAFAAEHAT